MQTQDLCSMEDRETCVRSSIESEDEGHSACADEGHYMQQNAPRIINVSVWIVAGYLLRAPFADIGRSYQAALLAQQNPEDQND